MKKAVIRNRIILHTDDELAKKIIDELTHRIPPRNHMETVKILKLWNRITPSTYSIPSGRMDLIPEDYEIIDKRADVPIELPEFKFTLRPSQMDVYNEVDSSCIINAAPSYGKTFTALALLSKLKQKTLVITHTTALRDQWAREVEKVYGFSPGIIGSGRFDIVPDIVIANTQTLVKKLPEVKDKFGALVVDECLDYEVSIDTSEGPMKLGVIVNNKLAVKVRSFDLETGKEVFKPVVNWYRNPETNCLKIKTSISTLKATSNHSIYVEKNGEIVKLRADELKVGDNLVLSLSTHNNIEVTPIKSIEPSTLTGNHRYNIEVADTHTYYANSILVANCHHSPSSTFSEIVDKMESKYKIGLSGTIVRKDGQHVVLPGYFSSKLIQPPAENAATPVIFTVASKIPFPSGSTWGEQVTNLECYTPEYQQLVVTLADMAADAGHKVLVVASRVEFLEKAPGMCKNSAISITGSVKDLEERNDLLASLSSSNSILFGTMSIFSEGISQNDLSCLILATPINNDSLLEQLIGRVVRIKEGKKQPVVFDIHLDGAMTKRQASSRMGFYMRKGFEIKKLT